VDDSSKVWDSQDANSNAPECKARGNTRGKPGGGNAFPIVMILVFVHVLIERGYGSGAFRSSPPC